MYSIIYIVELTPSSVMPQLLVQQVIILHSEWHIREALLSSQRVSSSSPNRLIFVLHLMQIATQVYLSFGNDKIIC
jgi:hypothetical protein